MARDRAKPPMPVRPRFVVGLAGGINAWRLAIGAFSIVLPTYAPVFGFRSGVVTELSSENNTKRNACDTRAMPKKHCDTTSIPIVTLRYNRDSRTEGTGFRTEGAQAMRGRPFADGLMKSWPCSDWRDKTCGKRDSLHGRVFSPHPKQAGLVSGCAMSHPLAMVSCGEAGCGSSAW